MSAIEKQLIKVSKYKEPKEGYEERQDYLAALAKHVNKLKDDEYDELTNDAADWVHAAIKALNTKDEIKEFPDADEEATDDAETAEADSDAEPADTDDEDDADAAEDAAAESDNEAAEAEEEVKPPRVRKPHSGRPGSKIGEKHPPTGDAEPTGNKPKPNRAEVIKEAEKRYSKISPNKMGELPKDRFGVVIGTKTHDAVVMYEKGVTSTELKKKLGGRHYNILTTLSDRGHLVERYPGGMFKLTHADDRKDKAKDDKKAAPKKGKK